MTQTRTFNGCQIFENQGNANSEGIPSTHEQPILQDPGDNIHENVHILDDHGSIRVKKGVTYARDIWSLSDGCKVVVDCNELAQPVDKAAGILSSWLGTVARNGRMCPLDFDDWRKLKRLYGNYLIGQVKLRFMFPGNMYVDGWILESLDQKWRNFKHALKEKFIPQDVLEDTPERELRKIEIISHVPPRVDALQWKNLVEYWFSSKSMKRSIAGKLAKQTSLEQGINLHTTGSKSYARKKKEFIDENGRVPGKIEFFQITHVKKRKNNEGALVFANDICQRKVEEATKILKERSLEKECSNENIENEVYNEVFRSCKSRVPRGYGLGARNSGFKEGYVLGQSMLGNEEFEALKSEIKDLKTQNETFMLLLSQNMAGSTMIEELEALKSEVKDLKSQNETFMLLLSQNKAGSIMKLPYEDALKKFARFSGGPSSSTLQENNETLLHEDAKKKFARYSGGPSSNTFQENEEDGLRSFLQFMKDSFGLATNHSAPLHHILL